MSNEDDLIKKQKSAKKYSETFKRLVVIEYESGKYTKALQEIEKIVN